MSDLRFNCPYCGGRVIADTAQAGTTTPCPHCPRQVLIPGSVTLNKSESHQIQSSPATNSKDSALTPKSIHFIGVALTIVVVILAFIILTPSNVNIEGEVFVVNDEGISHKLSLVPISIYKAADLDVIFAQRSAISSNKYAEFKPQLDDAKKHLDRMMNDWTFVVDYAKGLGELGVNLLDKIELARKRFEDADKQWNELISQRDKFIGSDFYLSNLPKPTISTKTNSDGRFLISVECGKPYYLVASASRQEMGEEVVYYWLFSVNIKDSNTRKVMLSSDNEFMGRPNGTFMEKIH